jgi:hypothetical protein
MYVDGTPVQQLFGFGIGSSPVLLGKLPHNEYLRVLFEQGIAGLILFLYAWRVIVRAAPASVRYVALIVAIYSISENNLDNFPFMSLFILFLSAREVVVRRASIRDSWGFGNRQAIRVRLTELYPLRSTQ